MRRERSGLSFRLSGLPHWSSPSRLLSQACRSASIVASFMMSLIGTFSDLARCRIESVMNCKADVQ